MADELGNALIDSATSDTIKDMAADALELGADALTDNDALKAIPVFGTLLKVLKGIMSFRDYQFTKVLVRFLQAYSTVSDDKRTEFLIKMQDEPEYKSKVGEKLIFILNRVDDIDKAEVLGNLFKAYVEGAFNLIVFYRLAGIVDKAFLQDIQGYGVDKVREELRNKTLEGMVSYKEYTESNENYRPLRKFNLIDLANAGFLNTTIQTSEDYELTSLNGDKDVSYISYQLNIYGALILKFALDICTQILNNPRFKIPEL